MIKFTVSSRRTIIALSRTKLPTPPIPSWRSQVATTLSRPTFNSLVGLLTSHSRSTEISIFRSIQLLVETCLGSRLVLFKLLSIPWSMRMWEVLIPCGIGCSIAILWISRGLAPFLGMVDNIVPEVIWALIRIVLVCSVLTPAITVTSLVSLAPTVTKALADSLPVDRCHA